MGKFRLLFVSFFILLFSTSIIYSQSTGKIRGKITDKQTGEPIPFANVLVKGTNLGAAADVNGDYVILNVRPGLVTVVASVVGYQKVEIENVRVNVDFTTKLDIELSSGAVDLPAVIVQGERNPLVRQDLTNPTVAITEENIQELPVDQISDIIKLQAGVVTGNDGSLHIRGGYGNEIAYTLNGISVNDPYGNSRSIGLATNAVKEVSVSTGTFAAQYGNALSGVVNYITKEGGSNYTFSIRAYGGDFATNRSDLFTNINSIDVLNRGRLESTLGGPLPFLKNANFYVSSVYENFKGSLYGIRLYRPTDSYLTPDNFTNSNDSRKGTSNDPYFFNPFFTSDSSGLPTGDGALVPMNWRRDFNFQGNISVKFSPLIKLKYEFVYNDGKSQSYSNSYKYNPDGRGTSFSDGYVQSLDLTHTINNNVFYTLKASFSKNNNEFYTYERFDDPRYMPNILSRTVANTPFLSGGTQNYREFRTTTTIALKGDLVAQLWSNHEFKAGFELRHHKLEFEGYNVEIGKKLSDGSFGNLTVQDLLYEKPTLIRRIPTQSPSLYTQYTKEPTQGAAYIQDKIELASTMILNLGLRYELFDPNAQFNPQISKNLTDSLSGSITATNVDAKVKHTLSPRISVSYPITDRGIIRFSYGHFYQIGSLASLYRNPNFFVANIGDVPTFGNANVDPQKSIQYELGLQQQLTDDFKFDLTGFYKDVSNYIFTQRVFTAAGREYNILTNLAYSNVRGITLSFLKRRSPGSIFSASLDYTFSIAEGNRTEPSEELFFSEAAGKQSETFLVPLGFDRSHVINGSISISQPQDWNIGVIFNLQTGTPYTPSLPPNITPVRFEQNSDSQPFQWNVDLRIEKYFTFGPIDYSVFVQVENLFDTENELFVYASSGRALANIEQVQNAVQFNDIRNRINRGDPGLFGIGQIDNFYSQRPERVNRPREVRLGFSLIFN